MRRIDLLPPFTLLAVAACALAACAHGSPQTALPSLGASRVEQATHGYSCPTPSARQPLRDHRICPHIFFIVQENRTLDNIFGGTNPFPGADAASFGYDEKGRKVYLAPTDLDSDADPDNSHAAWLRACNAPAGSGPPFRIGGPSPCRMNGFAANAKGLVSTYDIYSYVYHSQTKEYWAIAKTYALGDHFFMGHNSESYTAHQYIFSGQSNNVVDAPVYPKGIQCGVTTDECVLTPWGCDSPGGTATYFLDPNTGQESGRPSGPSPCFGYPSLAGPQYGSSGGASVSTRTRSARTLMRST